MRIRNCHQQALDKWKKCCKDLYHKWGFLYMILFGLSIAEIVQADFSEANFQILLQSITEEMHSLRGEGAYTM